MLGIKNNISNYEGFYDTGKAYEKFDFVYYSGDSRYYYAKTDVPVSGDILEAGEKRFTLDPFGPRYKSENSHFVYDGSRQIPAYQVGQNLNIAGSIYSNDGDYKILDVQEDYDFNVIIEGDKELSQILNAAEANKNWFTSEWFALGGGQFNWNGRDFLAYVDAHPDLKDQYLAGIGVSHNLMQEDWGRDHYLNYGQAENRALPLKGGASGSWVYHILLGWIYFDVNNVNPAEKTIWFSIGDTDSWFYAKRSLSSMSTESMFTAYSSSKNAFGHNGNTDLWAYWIYVDGVIRVYDYYGQKWYRLQDGSLIQESYSGPSIPPVPNDFVDPLDEIQGSTKIWVQGLTPQDNFDQYEIASKDQVIQISSSGQNLLPTSDYWVKDEFFFDADYGSTVNFKCNTYKEEYGDGYYKVNPNGINIFNTEFNLSFKNRKNREANAIIHFLENHLGQHEIDRPSTNLKYKQGISGFRWAGDSAFHPYDSTEVQSKKFYCTNFSHSLNFEDSNDITLTLKNYDTSLLQKSEGLFVKPPDDYDDSVYYGRDDVVFFTGNNQYYYFKTDYLDPDREIVGLPPAEMKAEWTRRDGNFIELNTGEWTRDFFWRPSIGLEVSQSPKMNIIGSEEGYAQVYANGENQNLLNLDLKFENREDGEAYSMLHFFEQHYGVVPFKFNAPAPYESEKSFICSEWSHTYNFKNNHTISAKFEEYPIGISSKDFIDLETPTIGGPAKIIFDSPLILAEKEDGVLYNKRVKKRLFIKNIGGSDATIDQLYISDSNFFKISGNKVFGFNYMPNNYQLAESIDATKINEIYEEITGSTISTEKRNIFLGFVINWKVADLVYAILNGADFMQLTPDAANINIIYKDLLNRAADTNGINNYLTFESIKEIIDNIQLSEEYKNLVASNVKIRNKQLSESENKINIPYDQLTELGINGKEAELREFDENGQNFKVDEKEYFQNNQGMVLDKSSGKTHACTYHISSRIFDLHGQDLITSDSDAYVDIEFFAGDSSFMESRLINESNEEIHWSRLNGQSGPIRVDFINKLFEGRVNILESNSDVKSADLSCFIFASDDSVNDAIWDVVQPLEIKSIDCPTIYWEGQETYRGLDYFSITSSSDPKKINTRLVWDEPNASLDHNLWIEYNFIAYSTDGAMLMPRGSEKYRGFQDIGDDSSWPSSISNNLKIVTNDSNVNDQERNTEDHTILSVEQVFTNLPNGYSSAYIQKGLVRARIVEQVGVIETQDVEKKYDGVFSARDVREAVESYNPDIAKMVLIAKPECWIEADENSAGNLVFEIVKVHNHGIQKDHVNQKYNLVVNDPVNPLPQEIVGAYDSLNEAEYRLSIMSSSPINAYRRLVYRNVHSSQRHVSRWAHVFGVSGKMLFEQYYDQLSPVYNKDADIFNWPKTNLAEEHRFIDWSSYLNSTYALESGDVDQMLDSSYNLVGQSSQTLNSRKVPKEFSDMFITEKDENQLYLFYEKGFMQEFFEGWEGMYLKANDKYGFFISKQALPSHFVHNLSFPERHSGGLKLNVKYFLREPFTVDEQRQVDKAIDVWERLILDDITIDVYIFDEDPDDEHAGKLAYVTSNIRNMLLRGLNGVAPIPGPSNMVIGAKSRADDRLEFIETTPYGETNLSSFYYTILHEFSHVLGMPKIMSTGLLAASISFYIREIGLSNDLISAQHADMYRELYDNLITYNSEFGTQFNGTNAVQEYQRIIAEKGLNDSSKYFYDSVPMAQNDSLHLAEYSKISITIKDIDSTDWTNPIEVSYDDRQLSVPQGYERRREIVIAFKKAESMPNDNPGEQEIIIDSADEDSNYATRFSGNLENNWYSKSPGGRVYVSFAAVSLLTNLGNGEVKYTIPEEDWSDPVLVDEDITFYTIDMYKAASSVPTDNPGTVGVKDVETSFGTAILIENAQNGWSRFASEAMNSAQSGDKLFVVVAPAISSHGDLRQISFPNELKTPYGEVGEPEVLSGITLGMLEDLGYNVKKHSSGKYESGQPGGESTDNADNFLVPDLNN